MRPIKFRGKRKDNGEWVYGSLVNNLWTERKDGTTIYEIIVCEHDYDCWEDMEAVGNIIKVLPETVGQFTGLKDKNGVEIYEGDKIDHYAFNGYVIFEDGMFSISSNSKKQFGGYRQPMVYHNSTDMEVIGNQWESETDGNGKVMAVNRGEEMSLNKAAVFGRYFGQKIIFENLDDNGKWGILQTPLMGMMQDMNSVFYCQFSNPTTREKAYRYLNDCKLILRPFESMMDDEMSRFNSYYKMEVDTKNHYKLIPKSIGYLISIGICINEDWVKNGWVIYESELNATKKVV